MLQISIDVLLGTLVFGAIFTSFGIVTKFLIRLKVSLINVLSWFSAGMSSFTGFYGISSVIELLQSNNAQNLNMGIVVCVAVGFLALQSLSITAVKYHLYN